MTESHDELFELCAGYALGVLETPEKLRFERHLEGGCPECERMLADCREASVALALTAPPVVAPSRLRGRVLEAAVGRTIASRGTETGARRRISAPQARIPWGASFGWATAALLATLLGLQLRATRSLEHELAELKIGQARLETLLMEEQAWNASMASPLARVAFFQPTPAGSRRLAGWALLDLSGERALLVLENLELEPGHDFELWGLREEGPKSLGLLEVKGTRALVRLSRVPDARELSAFAVSYEAKGGSPNAEAPAGPVVMVGELGT